MKDHKASRIASRISAKPEGTVRTAGKIEFIRDQGPVRRDIRVNGYNWSPESLRTLAKILWATQRSHSYAVSALRLFSKMPSSSFSPDGLLGGRGYIQSIKDMRGSLGQSVEVLASFTDTLYDEVNADHWDPVETQDSNKMVEKAEEVKENPEGFVEDAYRTEGESDFLQLNPKEMNPTPQDMGEADPEESDASDASEFMDTDDSGSQRQATSVPPSLKRSPRSDDFGGFSESVKNILSSTIRTAGGNSSIDTSTLPGPRIDHVGPGESEYGWFNDTDALPSDDRLVDGFMNTDAKSPYESGLEDGVTGYDNPTLGDGSSLRQASIETYSMLPGSNNNRIMPIYAHGLSQSEIDWMVKNSSPKVHGQREKPTKPNTSFLWGK